MSNFGRLMHSLFLFPVLGKSRSYPFLLLAFLLQRFRWTGLELFPSWVPQPFLPNPVVIPLVVNLEKFSPLVLAFLLLKNENLLLLYLRFLPDFY
jgi:hypothetical protein